MQRSPQALVSGCSKIGPRLGIESTPVSQQGTIGGGSPSLEETTLGDDASERADPAGRLEPGERLGRYVIIHRIGAGAMGEVFAAYDPELDRKVAIKLLHPDLGGAGSATRGRTRLLREAQAMARLSHPNTVTVHDVGEHRGRVFLAMEFVAGQTLGVWLCTPRSWRAIVSVFVAAGRGLAAAHAQGLIHRDFKPDNVMINLQGGVIVMDFGLARAAEGEADEREAGDATGEHELVDPPTSGDVTRTESSRLSTSLTRTGALVGTPAYMAPEQFERRPLDARSDQFSFCVALYEALFGERPFAGSSLPDLILAVDEGRLRPPPPGRRVPAWLRRVVLRGLAREPDRRWPDMLALIDALEHDPWRRRWPALIGGAGLGLVAFALGLVLYGEPNDEPPPVCSNSAAELSEIWNDARRAKLRESMLATQLSYADESADQVIELLDQWAERWIAGHRDACEATELHRSQSVEVEDQRMRCLARQRQRVTDRIDELLVVDETTLEAAVARVESLPRVERCADLEYIAAEHNPPPEDPAVAAEVARLERELERFELGFDDQLSRPLAETQRRELEQLHARAQPLGYAPLLAAIDLQLGARLHALTELPEAEQALRRAFFSGRAHGLDAIAVASSLRLITVVGVEQARYTAALEWAEHAAAEITRAGTSLDAAHRHFLVSGVYTDMSELETGDRELRAAIAIYERELPPDSLALVHARSNLAANLIRRGEYRDAETMLEGLRERLVARLGPDHPEVAHIDGLLLLSAVDQSDYPRATERGAALLALYERVGLRDDPRYASVLSNLGKAQANAGKHDVAKQSWEQALAMRERWLPPDHPDIADILINLASIRDGSEPERDIADFERAIAIYEAAGAKQSHKAAVARLNIGNIHVSLGKLDEAVDHFASAAELFSASLGPASNDAAMARFYQAYVLTMLERWDEAALVLRRIIEQLGQRDEPGRYFAAASSMLMHVELERGRPEAAAELVRDVATIDLATLDVETRFNLRFTILRVRHAQGEAGIRAEVLALQREIVAAPEQFPAPAMAEVETWLKSNR